MKRIVFFIGITSILFVGSCRKHQLRVQKKAWIENAFNTLTGSSFPQIKAIAWWNENFDQSVLRIDGSKKSLKAYRNGVKNSLFLTTPLIAHHKLLAPHQGIYHSAYPDFGSTEDVVSETAITDFETLAEKKIVWAYFSNNWYQEIKFPTTAVNTIKEAQKIPFIRMMPRSDFEVGGPDKRYTMQRIIDGDFDSELIQWARDAAKVETPLLVEFGTEVNGDWFPWNGRYNGGETTTEYGDSTVADGPERFRDAYRHIIDICNANGASNITWFFHVDAYNTPNNDWNRIENYYPGDEYIDWLGVSVYGPQEPDDEYHEFSEILNDVYPSLVKLADKPIAILEFAITE